MQTEKEKEHSCDLILMVGLPYSGKSTAAQTYDHPIVCPDAIRLALHGQRFIKEAESYVWAIARTMINALFLAGHSVVILDATNITKKRRDEWVSKKWKRRFHVVTTTKEECKRRALQAGDTEIIPIIEKMIEEYEYLTPEEMVG